MKTKWPKICIGHKRPDIMFCEGLSFATYNRLTETDWDLPYCIELNNDLPDTIIGEYHYLFALRKQIECDDTIENITITQYRRFVSNKPMGQQSVNQPWSSIITPSDKYLIGEKDLEPTGGEWLITSGIKYNPSITSQFVRHHSLRDWFRFLSDSCDSGVLSDEEAYLASHTNLLLPAPSCGSFPAREIISHLNRLELCALAFLKGGYRPYEGYQRRIIGFCLERLHSFFIQQSLVQAEININEVMGYQVTIGDGDRVKPTI